MDAPVVQDILQCQYDILIRWSLIDRVSFPIVIVLDLRIIEGTTMDVDILGVEESPGRAARFSD